MMATLSAPSSPISKSLQVSRSAAWRQGLSRVWISGQVRRVTKAIRREMRRRAAIEPVIGHLKEDHRMGRNYLTGRDGDRFNAVLAAAGYNFSLLLRWFEELLCVLLLILWHTLLAVPLHLTRCRKIFFTADSVGFHHATDHDCLPSSRAEAGARHHRDDAVCY
jgi:Transposase DDE domain